MCLKLRVVWPMHEIVTEVHMQTTLVCSRISGTMQKKYTAKRSSHFSLPRESLHLLTPRWNEGDISCHLCANHCVRVLNLTGQSGHSHRVEVGVLDFPGGHNSKDYKGVLLIKCDLYYLDALIIHKD